MKVVVCTLFEGNYHYGVGALANSLIKSSFRGDIFAGYRGELPIWATRAADNFEFNWINVKTLDLDDEVRLHFLPLDTDYHLTNFKPDFMLKLLDGPAIGATSIFYFDPDIVLIAPFKYLIEWVNCGIAVAEDVNSPLQENHPRRVAWRNYFANYNLFLKFKNHIYVNGGFIGLSHSDFSFLNKWKSVQEAMAFEIGGLNRSAFENGEQLKQLSSGVYAPFGRTDQDALNATIELYDEKISYMGKEAMGFTDGLVVIPHALGASKPWKFNSIAKIVNGSSPRRVEKEFWNLVGFPIQVYPNYYINWMKCLLKITSLITRFYKK